MVARVVARRLALNGATSCRQNAVPAAILPTRPGPTEQRRNKWGFSNPFSRLGKSSQAKKPSALDELENPDVRGKYRAGFELGGAKDNIFQEEIDEANPESAKGGAGAVSGPVSRTVKTKENTAMVLDPNPRARLRWQRKKVIQMIRKNGNVTKEERIRMTERQLVHRSHFLPTSVKKLVMLARQIAGKPIDNAIAQMRWSKKKMAAEIKYYLEEARDRAITERGMGLGRAQGEMLDKPRKIQTKEGKWIEVKDPTSMYVAQSWVGRGAWRGKSIDYKGRGRMGTIQHPSTMITVQLKEETTRIREYEEREAKKRAEGPWVHLPNRKILHQRPYYQW